MAELANYKCRIHYRSGKLNADADGLSRKYMYTGEEQVLVFPDILKTVSTATSTSSEEVPFAYILLVDNPDSTDIVQISSSETIPEPHSRYLHRQFQAKSRRSCI